MRNCYIIFLLCCALAAGAQSTNVLTLLHKNQKKADFFYDQKAWHNALELYLHITDKDPNDVHARIRIADCYSRLNDPVAAEEYYAQLLKENNLPPEAKYEYAETLLKVNSYGEAKNWYQEYAKEVPADPLPKNKIEFIDHLQHYLRDSTLTRVVPASINSKHSDFGPQYFKNGLVFVSSRNEDLFIKRHAVDSQDKEEAFLNLFYSKLDGDAVFGPVKLFGSSNLKSTYNDGPITFYDGYTKAVFTRNNTAGGRHAYDSSGRMNLELFFADVEPSGKMKNIRPFPYNHVNYSVAQASLTRNGSVIYFASDMPGGMGGTDIYYCRNMNGIWSEPTNAGPMVNTAGDEYYPFIQNDSTLFFSSNGRGGLGGLDIYLANRRRGKFREAINLGYPLNSSRDDFSMVTDSTGKIGYFASNRPGGEGLDDIYVFKADHYTAMGQFKESPGLTNAVPHVSIYVKDEDGNVISSTQSDSQGYFRLDLPLEENYSIWAKKEGYDVLEDIGYSTKGRDFGVDSIMFPMWKQDLYVKGKIYSKESQSYLPGAVVVLSNLTDNKIDSVTVNENGEYAGLVYPNKKYKVEVHMPGFIPDGYNLNTDGLYKGNLLNDVVVEEIYIEKSTINFDFNKMDLNPESSKEINKIVRTLLKFPRTTLIIRAHADSRGSAQYNQQVSDRRAQAVVQYMLGKGVPRNRMDAKGFGEELVLNRCSDGVECSEEEHSKNRRAELKIQRN